LESIFQDTKDGTLELFIPFIGSLVRKLKFDTIGPDEIHMLCDEFENTYGLRIPYHVMVRVLQDAQSKNILIFDSQHGGYRISPTALPAFNFDQKIIEHSTRWDNTVNVFQDFCAKQNTILSVPQAEAIFLSYLKSHDTEVFLSKDCESIIPSTDADTSTYLANAFINELFETGDKDNLEYIFEFALGHILASTIMNWNMGDTIGHLNNLNIYLDSPIVLHLVGVAEEPFIDAAKEFIDLLQKRGANIRVFADTITEVVDLLEGTKCWIGNSLYKPERATKTTTYVIDNGWSLIDVENQITNLVENLNSLGITVHPAPAAIQLQEFNIDEIALENNIVTEYKRHNQRFSYFEASRSIVRDVKSISSIVKLRKGKICYNLNKTHFIFVTRNKGLIRAVWQYESIDCNAGEREISSCINESVLATFAWIEDPDHGRTVGVKRVVAEALAAIQPSPNLVSKLIADLSKRKDEKEIDDKEYAALVADPLVRKELSRKTHNDSQEFTGQTTSEIINEYRQKFVDDANRELKQKDTELENMNGEMTGIKKRHENLAFKAGRATFYSTYLLGAIVLFILSCLSKKYIVFGFLLILLGGSAYWAAGRAERKMYHFVLDLLGES